MVRRLLVAVPIALHLLAPAAWAHLRADVYVTGLSQPVAFVQDPSASHVQYVVQQGGRIRVVRNGALEPTDFLNLASQISTGGERGLLGLAFAPDYGTSGRFFVNFTNTSGHTVIARFRRSAANPLVAESATRFDLLWPDGNRFITQPFANHNGGTLVFGPDGYLYIGMGDGGSGNDPAHRAQDPNTLLGKMLRLDVGVPDSDAEGYDVPPDNPFVDGSPVAALHEIWAFGLRNPWKFSFDDPARGGSGALLIADVGQNTWEEVDYQPPLRGGRNYGWRNREGAHTNVTSLPPAYQPLVDPIHEYDHGTGESITGGFVYRGNALGPSFTGRYFFADFSAGRVWSLALAVDPATGEATGSGLIEHTSALGGSALGLISSFGVDAAGELYVLNYSAGSVLRLAAPSPLMTIDVPAGGLVTQPFVVAGWAIDQGSSSGTGVDAVHVWAFPLAGGSATFLGAGAYGGARPDIAAAFGSRFADSGYSLTVRGLSPGAYQLTAYAHTVATGTFNAARTVAVTVAANPRMAIDLPAHGSTWFSSFRVAGWAIDLAAAASPGIDAVHVWAFPIGAGSPAFLGAASHGGARPDVGAAFGSQFTSSAYELVAASLAPGTYRIVVYAHSAVSGSFSNQTEVTVTVESGALMSLDVPAHSASVAPPFLVAGWALDRGASTTGSGVDAVHVWAFPVGGGTPVFLGAATYGVNRPDVGAAFGGQFTGSGFGLSVSSLTPGTYDVVAYAHSSVAGTFNNARVARVTVN